MALTAAEKQKAYRLRKSQEVIDRVRAQDNLEIGILEPGFKLVTSPDIKPRSWEANPRTIELKQELSAALAEIAELKRRMAPSGLLFSPPKQDRGHGWRKLAEPGALLKGK